MHLTAKQILRNPIYCLAFGLGSGLSPIAPGTCGTFIAVPFFLLFAQLPLLAYIGILVVTTLLGIWLCGVTARRLGVPDHPGIVWDEMVGYWLTMLATPPNWQWIALGFIYFRFFDIVKPWPIGAIDRQVKGGLGIMLDDILAGIFAGIALWGTRGLVASWIEGL